MDLEKVYLPIKQDLEEVEERLADIVASETHPVLEVYDYALSSGGKRIRPALVLLSAKSLDYNSSRVKDIACAVELIHTASLIHDDVIDSAKLRRSMPAVHIVWGTETAVTIGNHLFSRAMEILADYGNSEVVKMFSKAVKCMTEAELLQIANRGNTEFTEEKYTDIVSGKTASLISAGCEVAAKIACASHHYAKALSQYGLNFGIMYQIMDDILELTSTESRLGKPAANSIRERNLSLPIIYALRSNNGGFREQLLSVWLKEEVDYMELQGILGLISSSGALSYAQAVAREYAEDAKRSLTILMDSLAKECLLSFADLMVDGHPAQGSQRLAGVSI